MRFITRRSLARWISGLLFVALLLSAACTGSIDPLAADDQTPNFSHAAGEGYIGPAASARSGAENALVSPAPVEASPTPDLASHA